MRGEERREQEREREGQGQTVIDKRAMQLLLFTYLAHFHPFEDFVCYSFWLFL